MQMQFHANHSLLLQLIGELHQPKPNPVLLLEGPAAARLEFASAIAGHLNGQLQRADTPTPAANAGANQSILFFDEADSLFGRRSTVKNAHDRYANSGIRFRLLILGVDTADTLPPHILRRARRVLLKGH
jgi:hypothetical protein